MGRGWQLVIGLVCVAGALYTAGRSLEFRRHGVVVDGTVVAVESMLEASADGVSYSERTRVQYIPAGGGEPRTLDTSWRSSLVGGRREGDVVRIRHRPDAPDDAREDSLLFDWGAPVVLLLLGFGGLTGRLERAPQSWVVWRSGSD